MRIRNTTIFIIMATVLVTVFHKANAIGLFPVTDIDLGNTVTTSYDVSDLLLTQRQQRAIHQIQLAAYDLGYNETLLIQIAAKESYFHTNAENSRSSAKGLFQFVDVTWKELVGRYGKEYNLRSGDRTDAYKSTVAEILFLRDNAKYFETKMGRKPTNKELYLTHWAGPRLAVVMLQSSSFAKTDDVLGSKIVNANPDIKGKPMGVAIRILTKDIDND